MVTTGSARSRTGCPASASSAQQIDKRYIQYRRASQRPSPQVRCPDLATVTPAKVAAKRGLSSTGSRNGRRTYVRHQRHSRPTIEVMTDIASNRYPPAARIPLSNQIDTAPAIDSVAARCPPGSRMIAWHRRCPKLIHSSIIPSAESMPRIQQLTQARRSHRAVGSFNHHDAPF